MPVSTARPATDRQISFIQTLVAERTAEVLAPIGNEIADAVAGRPIRRDLIDRIMAIPRHARPASRADMSVSAPGAEDVPAPSTATRAGRMLRAGSIEATATLKDGRHVTVVIRTRTRSGRGWTNAALGEDGSRTTVTVLGAKLGWINRHGDVDRLTLRTRRAEYVDAIRAVLAYAAGQPLGGNVARVQEASRCGRCFRTLTDPVSIDRGIGPECYGRDTGSQHVPSAEAVAERSARRADRIIYGGDATVTGLAGAPTEQEAADFAEAAMNAAVAQGEREEHERAYAAEMREENAMIEQERGGNANLLPRRPAPSLTDLASRIGAPADANVARARDLIAEALDAYCTDADRDFAMRMFDTLAAR